MSADGRARDQLVAACRHLSAAGLSPGSSGNLSLRLDDHLLVTPTGSSLARVRPGDLAVVHLAGTVLDGRPSKEIDLHRAVYSRRPGTTAVVHLHSPYAVAAACLQVPDGGPTLPFLTPYQVMRVGDLPVAPYAEPGSPELAEGVAALAGDHAALLLANHGSLAAGMSLDAAVDLTEEIEAAAQVAVLVRGLPVRDLTPTDLSTLRART